MNNPTEKCSHPNCGFFQDGAGTGCRAMRDNACTAPVTPAPQAAAGELMDERARFEAWVTRDMGPIGTKRAIERHPFQPEEYADLIMQGRWADWQEAARATPAAAPVKESATAGEPTRMAYVATDLDGRFDVGRTPEEAKRRAGHGCDTVFPLFDIGAAASQAQAEPVAWMKPDEIAGLLKYAGQPGKGHVYGRVYAQQRSPDMVRVYAGPAPSAASSDARDAALEEAAKICDSIGKDWFDAGIGNKGWAAEYVAQQIRAAMSAPAAGEAS